MKYVWLAVLLSMTAVNAQNLSILQKIASEKQQTYNEAKSSLLQDLQSGKIVAEDVLKGITYIDENGIPIFTTELNEEAGKAANVDLIWSLNYDGTQYNLDGTDMEVYMWDGGMVRSTHQEFGNRVVPQETGSLSNHSTQVAGTIGAVGIVAAAKGMAPNVSILSYDFQNYETEIAAAVNAHISNHSYGIPTGWSYRNNAPYGNVDPGAGWYLLSDYSVSDTEPNLNGNYTDSTVYWDDVAYLAPQHIMVKSAGNSYQDGPNGTSDPKFRWDGTNWVAITGTVPANNCANGYDCLIMEATAKNIVVVGAINKINTSDNRYTTSSDVQAASFSSRGPRDDGGIKPDIVAVGSGMTSPSAGSNTSYTTNANGTSYSAPSVTGVMALWDRLYFIENNAYMRSDLAKALLCHTANECGSTPGPDYVYGWGLINALEGATTLVDVNSRYVGNETLADPNDFEMIVTASGTEPLKATISWLDPSADPIPNSVNNRTSRLVNDLDLRIIKVSDNTEYFPWKLDPDNPSNGATQADNTVDNVEQVQINAPVAMEQYKIVVSHKGFLYDFNQVITTSSAFGLVISGINQTAGVEDIDSNNQAIQVYPNPTQERLFIQLSNEEPVKSISIFDAQGKMVLYNGGYTSDGVMVQSLSNGVYQVLIHTESGKYSQSFIKK